VQAPTQGRILTDANLKKNADSAPLARLWYTAINPDVAPLDNVHCRKAVEYAADHQGYQRAYGGATGGDIATNMEPSLISGAQKFDLYNFASKPTGDVDSARTELEQCGQASGFATNLSYRAERPKEKAAAESLQQSLDRVGIKVTLKPFPQSDYFRLYAGKPEYAKSNNIGLIISGWGADWTDGFGFMQQIVDSRVIRASGGNTNLSVKLPEVDALVDQALANTDADARGKLWAQADRTVMENAVILPGVWATVLLYRPTTLTNVYVNQGLGGYYDFAELGVK
jgi:peptide/nickel transport system substrate-binding protein